MNCIYHNRMIVVSPGQPQQRTFTNAELAERLDVQADRIAEHDDNPYHITAYRHAAETLRNLQRPAADILAEQGRTGLEQLPGIGKSLARRIEQIIERGAREDVSDVSERQFGTIAAIGPELARRIHKRLGITTLAELYDAAYDGRLAQVPGIGPKRLRAVREALVARTGRTSRLTGRPRSGSSDEPSVEILLDIDREYRQLAALGRLPKVAPKRYNPTAEGWLPVLHAMRNGKRYKAFFSNTIRAHELGMTDDWVVILREERERGQWTVVTGRFGELRGRRVVCGRERQCRKFYERRDCLNLHVAVQEIAHSMPDSQSSCP